MFIHELMRHRDHRRTVPAGQRVNAGQRLKKIDDDVRLALAHHGFQRLHTLPIGGNPARNRGQGGRHVDLAAVLI